MTKLPDSGQRRNFETGAVRDVNDKKGRFDLLSPITLKRLAIHMQKGAEKYEARNWEKGIPLSVFFDSAQRHLWSWIDGAYDEDHLAAALWNIHGLIHTAHLIEVNVLPDSLNDLGDVDLSPTLWEVGDGNDS